MESERSIKKEVTVIVPWEAVAVCPRGVGRETIRPHQTVDLFQWCCQQDFVEVWMQILRLRKK